MSEELIALVWHNAQRRVRDLVPLSYNPRILTDEGRARLQASLAKFNLVEVPAINTDDVVVAGHQRLAMLLDAGRAMNSSTCGCPIVSSRKTSSTSTTS